MTSPEAQDLVERVRSAARLRRELAPYESDLAFAEAGGKVIYAIDSNIIWLFLDPRATGSRRHSSGGYTRVFSDDDDDIAAALGAALSRYILFRLNRFETGEGVVEVPLLLLDEHDAEVRLLYDRLMVDSNDRGIVVREDIQELKDRLARLASAPDLDEQVTRLKENAQAIIEWMYLETSEPAQASRLGALITAGRIARVQAATERMVQVIGPDCRSRLRNASAPASDLIGRIAESELRTAWERRLRSAKSFIQGRTLATDVRALSRLEILNAQLGPANVRVCLITGDAAMIHAANAYRKPGAAETFEESFIRHPRAFLAANEVLTPGGAFRGRIANSAGLVSGWLDTLLARFSDDEGPLKHRLFRVEEGADDRQLLERAERVLAADPKVHTNLRDEWAAHTAAIRNEHAASSSIAQEEIKRLIGRDAFDRIGEMLDQLEIELSATSDSTWDAYYRAVVRAGFDMVEPATRRRRNAPPINFQEFSAAREFVRKVIAVGGLAGFKPGEIDEHLRLIEEQGGGYAVLLAYAHLFADAGRWHVALLTAKRAIAVARLYSEGQVLGADGLPVSEKVKERVSGREAFFFAAVAQRLTARTSVDLDRAAEFLGKAHAALDRDNKRKDAPVDTHLRFASEALAGSITRFLLHHFAIERLDDEPIRAEPMQLRAQAAELFQAAAMIEDEWPRHQLERSALTNFFTCLAFEGPALHSDEHAREVLIAARRLVQLVDADKASPTQDHPVTELVQIVALYAEAGFLPVEKARRRMLQDALKTFEHQIEEEKAHLLMPYDYARYRHMVAISREALLQR